jgi:signal transduction histidine kinase
MFSPAVKAPVAPSSPEQIAEALENIGALHDLPFEDRMWLATHGREACVNAGDVLFEEGATADHMVLILKGEIHVRRQHGGPVALFIGRTGQMTGILPFSRMKSYGGQGFAVSPVWALLVARTEFPAMLEAIPSMAQRVVSTLLDRVREVTRIEQQAEKLSALGKLAGNLAHELNNPASAAQRAAAIVVEAVQANRRNRFRFINLCLNQEQIHTIEAWEGKVLDRPLPMPGFNEEGALDYLKREETVRGWLTQHGCAEAWEIAPELAEQGVTVADLDELSTTISPAQICISLQFFARYLRSSRAADTLLISTARIFDLIDAVKDYSNMDRAPILQVDVPAGLDATLLMFQSRMQHVKVERDYEKGLPRISAYSGELNQVWTALIENALDALGAGTPIDVSPSVGGRKEEDTLRITCRMEADMLLVEIWDTGPGIPPELQERIFEPFFTTKAPGRGLGLGLDYAMRVVRKHRGHLSVKSEPGSTCFRVRLPLDQLQAY